MIKDLCMSNWTPIVMFGNHPIAIASASLLRGSNKVTIEDVRIKTGMSKSQFKNEYDRLNSTNLIYI